ncbi:MAG: GNAT family N-acetyltransferase [Polyangiaceae bacterium]
MRATLADEDLGLDALARVCNHAPCMDALLPLEPPHDDVLAGIYRVAFAIEAREQIEHWWSIAGRDNVRVYTRAGTAVGGLVQVPMGLYAGGRSVSLSGLAGVAVAPEARGVGVGRAMLSAWLRGLREAGIATSALYASTRALYRSVGYELAGTHTVGTVHLDALRDVGRRDGAFAPITEADHAEIAAVYAEHARSQTGRMDRGSYLWRRVFAHRGKANHGYVLRDPRGVVAWVTLRQTEGTDGFKKVHVEDHFALDHDALLRLVGFLSTFGAMAREVSIAGPTAIWDLLPEHRADVRLVEPWLLRVVDVERALTSRGYPEGLEARFALSVDDPLFPENGGPWSVEVRDGAAHVTRVPSAPTSISVRGLASLFTGYASPSRLRLTGDLRGDTEGDARLGAAFAGNAPELGDFF